MKITKFHIKNYRSILDSGEISLDPKITTLIGKNESGKTCILKALGSFKINYAYTKDELCLHSEARKKLDSKAAEEGDIEIITIWFEMNSKDKRKLKEINPQLTKIKTLKITKYFDNLYKCESPEMSLEDIKSNVKNNLEKNLSEIRNVATTFLDKLENHSKRYAPFSNSRPQYIKIINEIISFDPETSPEIEEVFTDFINKLVNLPNMDNSLQNDIQTFIGEINPHKDSIKEILFWGYSVDSSDPNM